MINTSQNFFTQYDFSTILNQNLGDFHTKIDFFKDDESKITTKRIIAEYHKILSPDFPSFLTPYINLPIIQRLSGIGLLCGSDYTSLFKNRFFYTRLDHSIGVALIIWHFTKNKAPPKGCLALVWVNQALPAQPRTFTSLWRTISLMLARAGFRYWRGSK